MVADRLRSELRHLVDEDAKAYAGASEAYKIPKDRPNRTQVIDKALVGAAAVPLAVAGLASGVMKLARELGEIGNKNARSDAKVAEFLAYAALKGALENVRVNVASLSDATRGKDLLEEAAKLELTSPPS